MNVADEASTKLAHTPNKENTVKPCSHRSQHHYPTPTQTLIQTQTQTIMGSIVMCRTVDTAQTLTQTQITIELLLSVSVSVCVCIGVG